MQQLQNLVGLLARYAVMENLYQQSGGLALTDEYRNGLKDLCITILQYFGHAFEIIRDVGKEELRPGFAKNRERCDKLIDEIKKKDKACQGFRVVIEADEQSDTESEDADIEDVRDGSWELLGMEGSSVDELVT